MVKRERITIKRVASEAEVSTQTVSRVLNHRPDVAPETRKRVEEVIERLGYHPSVLARSLIQRRSYTLGVVTAGLKYIGPSRTLNGIAQQAEAMGYALLLKELPGFDTNDVQPLIQSLLSRQVDGILWAVPEIGENRSWLRKRLPDIHVPIIFLTMAPQPGVSIVTIDNYSGGCLATQHLLDQGYQRIGHISGPLDWWESRQRKAGWQDTLTKAGIKVKKNHWVEGNWSSSSGERAFHQLMAQFPDMQAVFVANDQMALSVLQIACKNNVNVPGALAVVGFDGLEESPYFSPPLTTVNQDQNLLGCTAVEELVQIIEASQQRMTLPEPKTIVLRSQLIIRESSTVTAPVEEQTRKGEVTGTYIEP